MRSCYTLDYARVFVYESCLRNSPAGTRVQIFSLRWRSHNILNSYNYYYIGDDSCLLLFRIKRSTTAGTRREDKTCTTRIAFYSLNCTKDGQRQSIRPRVP